MADQVAHPGSDHIDIADAERRIKAIFIGSIGRRAWVQTGRLGRCS